MKIALCAIAKLEHNYIVEWVEHYKSIGFDHIFIYDNNESEQLSFKNILKSYIDSNFITLIPCYMQRKYQLTAYYLCFQKYKTEYDYIAYFDVDEFLILNKTNDIHEYLSNPLFDKFDSICINYKTFGDSDLIKVENNNYNCLSRFTKPIYQESWKYKDIGYKKIVKTNVNIKHIFDHVHSISYVFDNQCNNKGISIKTLGNDNINRSFLTDCNREDAQLNHYCTKTIEEYKEKIKRGGGVSSTFGYNYDNFFSVNEKTPEKIKLTKFFK